MSYGTWDGANEQNSRIFLGGVEWLGRLLVKGGQDFLYVAFLSTNYGRRSSPQKSGLPASVKRTERGARSFLAEE